MAYLDQQRIRRAFRRAAGGFDEADFFYAEIRQRLLERLELVRIEPLSILDLGAGTLGAAEGLKDRYPNASIIALDREPAMLAAGAEKPGDSIPVCADAIRAPFPDQCFGLIYSNLMLPVCDELPALLAQMQRVLAHPGLFCFTTLGPDSLMELREAWRAVDNFSHILPFMDMHDLGDALVTSGFAEPVMDREILTITYEQPAKLIKDLKNTGSVNALPDGNPGLTGRRRWGRMLAALEAQRGDDGCFSVTLEVIYGEAWAGKPPGSGYKTSGPRIDIPVEVAGQTRKSFGN